MDPEEHRMSRTQAPTWVAHLLSLLVFGALVLLVVRAVLANDGSVHGGTEISLVVSLVVGWILAWKRPHNPIGWLLVAIVGFSVSQVPAVLLAEAIRHSAPVAAAWLYSWGGDSSNWNWIPPTGLLFTQLPLRFPNGSLPTPRWRWFSWYTIGAIVVGSALSATMSATVAPGLANPIYLALRPELSNILNLGVFGLLFLPSFAGSLASLFVRYRRSDAIERAQLRWVFWGLCIAIGLLVVFWLIPSDSAAGQALESWALGAQALIPASILFAVLRYRLYDIDRIISRTVSYAIVTIVIVGVYVGVVLGIGALLPQANSVGVAIATLAAAAVFLPLLRRVQGLVDRRFNRAAYNAQKVVDAFGERLRSGANPHAAGDDLVNAVEQTLQPSAVGIWTRTVSG
jgi:hypothetical protein